MHSSRSDQCKTAELAVWCSAGRAIYCRAHHFILLESAETDYETLPSLALLAFGSNPDKGFADNNPDGKPRLGRTGWQGLPR